MLICVTCPSSPKRARAAFGIVKLLRRNKSRRIYRHEHHLRYAVARLNGIRLAAVIYDRDDYLAAIIRIDNAYTVRQRNAVLHAHAAAAENERDEIRCALALSQFRSAALRAHRA